MEIVVQCLNGDFFDANKYERCPHCGAPAVSKNAGNKERPSIAKLFKKDKLIIQTTRGGSISDTAGTADKTEVSDNYISTTGGYSPNVSNVDGRTQSTAGYENGNTGTTTGGGAESCISQTGGDGETVSMYGYGNGNIGTTTGGGAETARTQIGGDDKTMSIYVGGNENGNNQADPFDKTCKFGPGLSSVSGNGNTNGAVGNPQVGSSTGESLQAVVGGASANNQGKTMGFFDKVSPTNTVNQTPVVRHANGYVVGWLVAISGEHLGQSFEIGAGRNSIGRNEDNNIVLNLDGKVSGSKHAYIIYEPEKRVFYLQPSDSSGLTYLNSSFCKDMKKLSNNDLIKLGDTSLLFIPLCGKSFTWEKYIK